MKSLFKLEKLFCFYNNVGGFLDGMLHAFPVAT
jgi:hypothetical protein